LEEAINMKFTSILAALTFSSVALGAPMSLDPRRLLPSPMQAVDALFPGSGIPKVTGKILAKLGVCKLFIRLMR
jgi:hypothetical protein